MPDQQLIHELAAPCRIGILSDTHRELPNRVFNLFSQVQHIIHAGDIGEWDIIVALQALAPVTAVYGNCDPFSVRRHCPLRQRLKVAGIEIDVTHVPTPSPEQEPEPIKRITIFGHLHVPSIVHCGDLLCIQPGSVSRPREGEPATVALLEIPAHQSPRAEIIPLR